MNIDTLNTDLNMKINDIIDNKFEKLDIAWLKKNAKMTPSGDDFYYQYVLENDSISVFIEGDAWGYSMNQFNTNHCFRVFKEFYPNGNIKEKGWMFNSCDTKKGIWYEFDEDGNLERSVDYDKLTKFTFEDALNVCEKENIPIQKGYKYLTGGYANISRYFDDAASCYRWSISWLKSFDIRERIVFDGKTGKILERIEKAFISN